MVIGHPVSTSHFSYSAARKTFVGYISDFDCNLFGRLYDDAADIGFRLVSAKTGREAPVFLRSTETDDEGDILSWTFSFVALQYYDIKIVVFND